MKKKLFILLSSFLLANEANVSDVNKSVTVLDDDVTFLNDNFVSEDKTLNIAIVVNKKKFYRYLPNLINSINAYLMYKDVDYNLSIHSTDENLSNINAKIVYIDDEKADLNKTIYYPILRGNDNNYYGGIDYKAQLEKLSFYLDKPAVSINSNEKLPQILLETERELNLTSKDYFFPKINYSSLNNQFLIFNTPVTKTVQVLSEITYKNINTLSMFSTQINYSPYIISLTQPQDREKLLIANSIVNIPLVIKDYNRLLDTDIEFNWLNYTTSVLLNKMFLDKEDYYLADFDLYMIDHHVEYPVKIYQIRDRNFQEVR